ncbi:hypothetical protein [Pseudomonas sp. RGM2987]|uniref:hypothetical protein n=1 Tax=Pseudomonas sp. RGM2987 TaxID=2930090 RepID=UPI001FD6CE71|nr:hypothetical protein [Pseudomonas sp. RGM2987]MCJ8204135.1 hypothetical protein [Pseudomonas sp. RGM2987]
MLAPVIFISLRWVPEPGAGTDANAFGGCRLKRAADNNQYLFYKFFTWNIFSNTL